MTIAARGARTGQASPPASSELVPASLFLEALQPSVLQVSCFSFTGTLPGILPRAAVTVETEPRSYRARARTHPLLEAHCVAAPHRPTPPTEATPQPSSPRPRDLRRREDSPGASGWSEGRKRCGVSDPSGPEELEICLPAGLWNAADGGSRLA